MHLFKIYYGYPDNIFIPYQVQDMFLKGISLIEVYRRIGFDESADLLRDARIVYRKQQIIGLRSWIDQQIKANGQIHIFEKFLS